MTLLQRSNIHNLHKNKCPDCGNEETFIKVFFDVKEVVRDSNGFLNLDKPVDYMPVDNKITCSKCYKNFDDKELK